MSENNTLLRIFSEHGRKKEEENFFFSKKKNMSNFINMTGFK